MNEEQSRKVKRLALEWLPFKIGKESDQAIIKRTLRNTPLFEKLSSRDWHLMTGLFHLRTYKANEIIFEKGTPGLGMYVIIDGSVKITTEEDGDEVVIVNLSQGDFFGEMSLIDEVERSANAISDTETKMIGIFRPQLQELMTHRPRLGIVIFQRLASIVVKRLREANKNLTQERNELESRGADESA